MKAAIFTILSILSVLFMLAVAAILFTGCTTTQTSPINIGDGKVLGALSTEQAAALIPLLAAAAGNPNAAALATLFRTPAPAQTASSRTEWIAVDDTGQLKVPETLLAVYAKLTPQSQASALAAFVAYQRGEQIRIADYRPLVDELIAVIKQESPTFGALAQWGVSVYLERQANPVFQQSNVITATWTH